MVLITFEPIGNPAQRLKLTQMIKFVFKDTPIQIFLLDRLPLNIADPTVKQQILKELHDSKIRGNNIRVSRKPLNGYSNIIRGRV